MCPLITVAVCQDPYPFLCPWAIGCLRIARAVIRTVIMGLVIAIRVRVYLKSCSAVLSTKAC